MMLRIASCNLDIFARIGMWKAIKELVYRHERFILSSHINPDGDALGSELALAALLRAQGKEVSIINKDTTPAHYRFLDQAGEIRVFEPERDAPVIARAEVIFVLDASAGWDRVGKALGRALQRSRAKVGCIDHHFASADFADVAVVRHQAAATAELIYGLFRDMAVEITLPVAEAIYVAIMTDTDCFCNSAAGPQAHYIAAELLQHGVDPSKLYSQVYQQYPPGRLLAQGDALSGLRLEYGGRLAWYGLKQEQLLRYNITYDDLEHFPSMGLDIKGVKVSLFLVETRKGDTKISLRSKDGVLVNGVAQLFGGGGHAAAAGAIIRQPLRQAAAEVISALAPLLAEDD
jgi:phosphoesterase RecJ-like protein